MILRSGHRIDFLSDSYRRAEVGRRGRGAAEAYYRRATHIGLPSSGGAVTGAADGIRLLTKCSIRRCGASGGFENIGFRQVHREFDETTVTV